MTMFNFNANRDAWSTIRGFVYQADLTVLRWLQLEPGQLLELERGEDIDVVEVRGVFGAATEEEQVRCLEQVKRREANVSLRTDVSREAMANFSDHRQDNAVGHRLSFRFFTTAGIAVEDQGLPNRQAGITVWEDLRQSRLHGQAADEALAALRTFLKSLNKPEKVSDASWVRFQEVLADPPPGALLDFVRRFEWSTGAPDSGELQTTAMQLLADRFDVSPGLIELAYARLFLHVFEVLSQPDLKRLGRDEVAGVLARELTTAERDLYRVIRDDVRAVMTYLQVTLPRIENAVGLVQQDAKEARINTEAILARFEAQDARIIWRTFGEKRGEFKARLEEGSAALLSWKFTLEDGSELTRPEYAQLLEKVLSQTSSTTLLLGPPGAGKSALLAKLAHELKALGIPFWAIKADAVPRSITSVEDLSKDLFPPHISAVDVVRAFAEHGKIVVLIDQLDAVSQLMDQKSDRLVVLLRVINALSKVPNVHIVASSREFEANHDVRLKDLKPAKLALTLPPREVVVEVLAKTMDDVSILGDDTLEMLRTPWNLNNFMELREPGVSYTSDIALLEAFWNKQVMTADDGKEERVRLVELVARLMLEDEDLWLPLAAVGGESKALQQLEASGILLRGAGGATVGFRHQTLFEFSLTRQFAADRALLPEVVRDKQGSLFVRPLLLNALRYLREMRRPVYRTAIEELLAPTYRRHIRALMIEFLSRVENPDADEIAVLLSLLVHDADAPKVFDAVTGKRQWFNPLKQAPAYDEWLGRSDLQVVWRAAFPLRAAVTFDLEAVLDYIRALWLDDAAFDRLVLDILGNTEVWTDEAANVLARVVRRTDSWLIAMMLNRMVVSLPEHAPVIVRADLDRRLEQADQEAEAARVPGPDDDGLHGLLDRPRAPYRTLINSQPDWYDLANIPKAAPRKFITEVWPWFETILERLRDTRPSIETSYLGNAAIEDRLDDHPHSPTAPILACLKLAIELEATRDPAWFLTFAQAHEPSEDLLVHRLLAYGYVKLASQQPGEALNYLLGDARRLKLGDFMDGTRETELLVKALSPFVSTDALDDLAARIREMTLRLVDIGDLTAEQRARLEEYERMLRFQVVDAIPAQYRSPTLARWIEEQATELPGARTKAVAFAGGLVGPRMTAEEMNEASNDDLLLLFDALPDAAAWEDPQQWFDDDVSRAGGSVQQAREFTRFAVAHPDRAQEMLARLTPGHHERYAASAIDGLVGRKNENAAPAAEAVESPDTSEAITPAAHGPVPTELIERLIEDLVQRGFGTPEFRSGIADALSDLAHRDHGLSPNMIAILTAWYFTTAEPPMDERELSNASDENSHGSIFRGGYSATVVGGRGYILLAIMEGYLLQKPRNLEGWMGFVESMLPYERNADLWGHALLRMPVLFNLDRPRATRAFDAALTACPALLGYRAALIAMADVIGAVEPRSTFYGWLEQLRERGTPFALNGYGQLLFFAYAWFQEETTRQRIRELLQPGTDPKLLLGLAHTAAVLWHREQAQPLALEIFKTVVASEDDGLQRAVDEIFAPWNEKKFRMDYSMRQLLAAIGRSPEVLLKNGRHIVMALRPHTDTAPEVIFKVVRALIDAAGERLNSHQTDLPLATRPLTEIVLSLYRVTALRARSLDLFEDLLDLNLKEAHDAMNEIDAQVRWTERQ